MAALLEVEGLKKRYRRRGPWALAGVSFSLQPGQVLGLLGLNGAGKTTTVKTIAGLLRPTEGTVRILGRPPGDARARAELGYASESPAFPRFLRADEVLDYVGRLLRLPDGERQQRVAEVLAWASLEGERRQVRHFSKGMRQRLGLAQAILGRPRLLILDEPTADLDPLGRRDVRSLIERLKGDGVGVLLNSHLLSEVEWVCDAVMILHRGEVVRSGPIGQVVREGQSLEDVFVDLVEGAS